MSPTNKPTCPPYPIGHCAIFPKSLLLSIFAAVMFHYQVREGFDVGPLRSERPSVLLLYITVKFIKKRKFFNYFKKV